MQKVWVCVGSLLSLADSYYRCYRDAHPNFPKSDSDLAFEDPMMRSKSFDPRIDRNKRAEMLEVELKKAEAEALLQQIQAREEPKR
jgi:hypothetical protein